jgi:hypothetical protein
MSIRLELRRLDVLLRAAAKREGAPDRADFLKNLAAVPTPRSRLSLPSSTSPRSTSI